MNRAILAGTLLFAACDQADTTGQNSGSNSTLTLSDETFATMYGQALCDRRFDCDQQNWATIDGYDACVELESGHIPDVASDPCIELDEERAQECLDAVAVATCEELPEGQALMDPCWNTWIGTDHPDCYAVGFVGVRTARLRRRITRTLRRAA